MNIRNKNGWTLYELIFLIFMLVVIALFIMGGILLTNKFIDFISDRPKSECERIESGAVTQRESAVLARQMLWVRFPPAPPT